MERKKASEFPQELLNLFDKYVHGDIQRREFLEGARKFAVGGLSAAAILEALNPNFAWAQQVAKDDSRIEAEYATVASPNGNGSIRGYFAKPAQGASKAPGVLVIHENRGLNPYIEDVARRVAVEGFLAFAPDGLTSVGGYPGNEDDARKMFPTVDREKMTVDFIASAHWLKKRDDCTGKIGVMGFCFGGGMSNMLASRLGGELSAAVPYYGGQVQGDDVAKIQAPLLLHYAGLDERVNAGWPAYEQALKAGGKTYTAHIYENTNHGFHNDTTPRYDESAAKLSWTRTISFLNKHLR